MIRKKTTAVKIVSHTDGYFYGYAYLDAAHLAAWEKEKTMTNPQGTGFAFAGNILNEAQRKRMSIHSVMTQIRVEPLLPDAAKAGKNGGAK